MGEVEWRKEMVPLLIEKGLGYPNRNVRFEKDHADVKILDDRGIQHIVIETKSNEGKLGRVTLKQATTYLKGGESFVILASQHLWKVFRPGATEPIGEIRFNEDGIDNETLFLRLSREFMQDNKRFADFREGTAPNAYIAIDEAGFPKLVEALQQSVDMLFRYAVAVWPHQVELYQEYVEKKKDIDDTIASVKRSGETTYQQAEKLRILDDAARKLKYHYAIPIEANDSFEIFKRIQPYSGVVDEKKILDVYLREASHLALNRALLIRILEDKKLLKPKISNGGIRLWRQLTTYLEKQYQALLRFGFQDTELLYHHFFAESAFDWYLKVNGELGDVVEIVLFLLNSYDFSNVDRDLLSKVYQEFFSPEKRKKLGEFYTPPEVIKYLLQRSGWPGEGSLLDFSCGSGGFLVESLKQLLADCEKRGISAERQWDQAGRVVGFDINPFAVHITEMNLLGLMVNLFAAAVKEKMARGEKPQLPDLNVFCINALLRGVESNEDGSPRMGFEEFPGERFGDALDHRDSKFYRYVVGNPPYVRNERLDEADKKSYARLYDDVREGNTDLYGLFIRKAFDWLEKGGTLAVIVSQGLAEARAEDKVRRFVEQFQIEEIVPLEWANVFLVATNPFLLIVKKQTPPPGHKIKLRQGLRSIEQLDDPKAGRITEVEQESWKSLAPDGSWRLEVTADDLPILKKLNGYPKPFKGEYGMALRSGDQLIGDDPNGMKNPKPILDGREVKPWSVEWQGRYIDYDKEAISDAKSDVFFESISAVLPRISLTTQCAVLPNPIHYRNTVMKITSELVDDPYLTASLINSKLNRFYVHILARQGVIQQGWSTFYIKVISQMIAPINYLNAKVELIEKSQTCHSLAKELAFGDGKIVNETTPTFHSKPHFFSDLPDSDLSSLSGDLDLSLATFTKDGALTDGTLFSLRGDIDALFYIVHHAQLAGKASLTRTELESYSLPSNKEQMIAANKLIAAWLERKPTLEGQLRAAETEIDELVFSVTDLTKEEIATIKRRCTEFPLNELLKPTLPGKPTKFIKSQIYVNRYKEG